MKMGTTNIIVRQAIEQDLKQIADVHIKCFPDSFSTQLGKARGGAIATEILSRIFERCA